jgi:trk system potassium uptake protein TrkH
MVACVSNCGLAFGDIGPSNNFADISVFSKWFMTFAMLLGRLEIFTVLLLFTPVFWEK